MDNKQIIHIATEVITIVGLTIYFSKQTKKLFESIETLTTSLNEQNEVIQKHENMINKLLETVQQLTMQQQFQPPQPVPQQYLQPQHEQIKPQTQPKVLQPQQNNLRQNKEPVNKVQETLEPQFQSRHIQYQFMQRPLSPEFKNDNKVEEILDSEDEEDEKIVEEELLDDELADELKELDE